jgi:hypothetical protein
MKIAIIAKRIESAVTYYRANAVFSELCRANNWQCGIYEPRTLTDDFLHTFDIVFFHRPILPSETFVLWKAKKAGIKVWLDIDDLLWAIPLANPARTMFSPDDQSELLTNIINADVVTCTTKALADAIQQQFNRTAIIIPNAYNDRHGEAQAFNKEPKRKTILWRGSNTHDGDLFVHRSAFREYKDLQHLFFGSLPWYLHEQYGGHLKTLYHSNFTQTIIQYLEELRKINPTFMIVPLEDNEFNRAKSNIAAIEATMYAGAVTIYPSYMPEFTKFPGIPYDNAAHLGKILAEIDREPAARFAHVHRAAVDYVNATLKLSDVNQARAQVAQWLTEQHTTATGKNAGTDLTVRLIKDHS